MSDQKPPLPSLALSDDAHPILTHEKSLANKIAKGSEAGDILDQQLIMLGIQLVTQLNVLIKTSRIHGRTNAALDKPVDSMLTLIRTLSADHPVVLRLQNDFLFLGDSHLKMTSQQMAVFSSIIEALNKWKIGGVSFSPTTDSKDLREFAYLFVSMDADKHSLADLQQALADAGVKGIELEEPRVLQLRHLTDGSADGGRKHRLIRQPRQPSRPAKGRPMPRAATLRPRRRWATSPRTCGAAGRSPSNRRSGPSRISSS